MNFYLVSEGGKTQFSQVTSFMKRSPLSTAEYLFISTTTNTTIRMTGEHLIYNRKSDAEMFRPRSVATISKNVNNMSDH